MLADAQSLDGLNIHCAVVDEVHAHKTRAVWDVLETATGAREQPLLLPITTAGANIGGICFELMTYLHKVLDRVIDDETFFGINYTIDDGDEAVLRTRVEKGQPELRRKCAAGRSGTKGEESADLARVDQ